MKSMITLYADEGMILTDGENYGTTIQLAEGRSPDEFTEITNEEYEKILKDDEKNVLI